ncbi:MAG: hypothetical protein M3Y04_05965 [Actinomycetota bacterium]|nr:hypothetical protein [Actinomycetota bacterium]
MSGRVAGQVGKQVGVVVVGLALGLGGIALVRAHDKPTYHPHPPTVRQFAFPAGPPAALAANTGPAEAAPAPTVEPADARAALTAVLQALAAGTPEQAYPLLDTASHTRYPSLAAWTGAQADLVQPLTFDLGASRPAAEQADAVDVDVAATHKPSLDPFRGLVPARSQSVWEIRREAAGWRVGSAPITFKPVLPADASAGPLVQDWVTKLAACDTAGAASFQVTPNLYGPAGLVRAPCDEHGTWTAGKAEGLDHTSDPKVFLAAFGPEVGIWARLVPVQGPGMKFLAAVAPMGDGWQVMGVAVDG